MTWQASRFRKNSRGLQIFLCAEQNNNFLSYFRINLSSTTRDTVRPEIGRALTRAHGARLVRDLDDNNTSLHTK